MQDDESPLQASTSAAGAGQQQQSATSSSNKQQQQQQQQQSGQQQPIAACLTCRRSKLKCVRDPPNAQTCARCLRTKEQCVTPEFRTSSRPFSPSQQGAHCQRLYCRRRQAKRNKEVSILAPSQAEWTQGADDGGARVLVSSKLRGVDKAIHQLEAALARGDPDADPDVISELLARARAQNIGQPGSEASTSAAAGGGAEAGKGSAATSKARRRRTGAPGGGRKRTAPSGDDDDDDSSSASPPSILPGGGGGTTSNSGNASRAPMKRRLTTSDSVQQQHQMILPPQPANAQTPSSVPTVARSLPPLGGSHYHHHSLPQSVRTTAGNGSMGSPSDLLRQHQLQAGLEEQQQQQQQHFPASLPAPSPRINRDGPTLHTLGLFANMDRPSPTASSIASGGERSGGFGTAAASQQLQGADNPLGLLASVSGQASGTPGSGRGHLPPDGSSGPFFANAGVGSAPGSTTANQAAGVSSVDHVSPASIAGAPSLSVSGSVPGGGAAALGQSQQQQQQQQQAAPQQDDIVLRYFGSHTFRIDAAVDADPVCLGLVTLDEAESLLASFYTELSHTRWGLDRRLHTVHYIRQRSSLLITAILAAASKFAHGAAAMSRRLQDHQARLIRRVAMDGFRSVEIVLAFLVCVPWMSPTEHMSEDPVRPPSIRLPRF